MPKKCLLWILLTEHLLPQVKDTTKHIRLKFPTAGLIHFILLKAGRYLYRIENAVRTDP